MQLEEFHFLNAGDIWMRLYEKFQYIIWPTGWSHTWYLKKEKKSHILLTKNDNHSLQNDVQQVASPVWGSLLSPHMSKPKSAATWNSLTGVTSGEWWEDGAWIYQKLERHGSY